MTNVLTASGFSPSHYPTFTQNLRPTVGPPPTHFSNPWGVPAPSISNKFIEPMTNGVARSYVRATPFLAGWEANYAEGMPLFVNSKRATPGSASVLVGTPATVNYCLEEGARTIYQAQNTARKRKRDDLVNEYQLRDHLYCCNVPEFMETWRPYGVIYSILGKNSETGMQGIMGNGDEYIFNCSVNKTSRLFNYWGARVGDGDRLYFLVGQKRNIYSNFYDPNGSVIGSSLQSPETFMQLIPVSFSTKSYSASHNRNWTDLDSPFRDDVDFLHRNLKIEQQDVVINEYTGEFTPKPLELSREIIKTDTLLCDLYSFGALIPVGVVNKGSRGKTNPSEYDLQLAMRDNNKAQTLEQIEVFLGC